MGYCRFCGKQHNVGFVSTRISGTDGVSLEISKWAAVFGDQGLDCFYFAGDLDRPEDRSYRFDEAYFKHPEIRRQFKVAFGYRARSRSFTNSLCESKERLKTALYGFLDKYDIHLLVPQNALTIPLNIPLGVALTEVIAETSIPTIAHHHDFFWERQEFLLHNVWDYLNMAFPPHLPSMKHVVINSAADHQLSLRTGISPVIIPNVMNFENPPPPPDDYSSDIRHALGVDDDEVLVLQPTRVVKRKGIEHAIELVKRLNMKAKLIISHASGDEEHTYERRIRDYSEIMGVNTRFVSNIIGEKRGMTEDGRKIYSLYDLYPFADLITYPSNKEGFGNAFLEAVYHKKPIMVNAYSIYATDIKPKGFKAIEIDGYVTDNAVRQTRKILEDKALRDEMVSYNYSLASKHYSYSVLRQKLDALTQDCMKCGSMARER